MMGFYTKLKDITVSQILAILILDQTVCAQSIKLIIQMLHQAVAQT